MKLIIPAVIGAVCVVYACCVIAADATQSAIAGAFYE